MMQDDLIRRAKIGDQRAFQQLVESYSAIGWRTARVLLSSPALVDDVLQEAWLDAWRGLPRFQQDRPFRPWLLAIIANRCRMAIRRQSISTVPLEHISIDEVMGDDDPLESLLFQETDVELQDVLAKLPIEQQRVLELRFFAELDLAEIALITATPLGTVKSRLHRALHTLRTRLQMPAAFQSHMEEKR